MRIWFFLTISLLFIGCGPGPTPSEKVLAINLPGPKQIQQNWGTLNTPRQWINSLEWRPDGNQFSASISIQKILPITGWEDFLQKVVWETKSNRLLANFGPDSTVCNSGPLLTWSPDQKHLLCGRDLLDTAFTPVGAQLPEDYSSEYSRVSWKADGSELVGSRQLNIFDASNFSLLRSLNGPDAFQFLKWSPDGSKIASDLYQYQDGKRISVFNASTGDVLFDDDDLSDVYGSWYRTAWSPDGGKIAILVETFRPATEIRILEASTGMEINRWEPAHFYGESLRQIQPNLISQSCYTDLDWNASNQLTVGDCTGKIHLYAPDGTLLKMLPSPDPDSSALQVQRIAWNKKADRLLVGYSDGSVVMWEPANATVLGRFQISFNGHAGNVYNLTILNGQDQFISTGRDGAVSLHDTQTGMQLQLHHDHQAPVYAASWNQGASILATGDALGHIIYWRYDRGQLERSFVVPAHTDTIRQLVWSPDGLVLASASWDNSIKLWNPKTITPLLVLNGHQDRVNALAYHPSGKLLATASSDRTIRIWDTLTGSTVRTLNGHQDSVFAVAWSPDGKYLASGSSGGEGKIKIWDTTTWQETQSFVASSQAIRALVWSADQQTLFSAGDDSTLRVWNAPTASLLLQKVLEDPQPYGLPLQSPIFSLALSADGKKLITGQANGKIKSWSLQ